MSINTILILNLIIPFVMALIIPIFKNHPNVREYTHIVVAFLNFVMSILLLLIKTINGQAIIDLIKINQIISFTLYIETFGILFSILVNFLWIIAIIYSMGYMRAHHETNQTRFFSFFALAIGCTLGVAYSYNLYTSFLFYELLTLSTIPLVAHNFSASIQTKVNTYIITLIGASMVLFLPAIVLTTIYTGSTNFTPGGVFIGKNIPDYIIITILLLFIFGISKVAIMPLHKWLPSAMVAPTPVSALLHGVAVVKSGAFIFLKIIIFIFGYQYLESIFYKIPYDNYILAIPCFTTLMASTIAIFQKNLKKRLAYSTIAQLSYIVLGCLLLNYYSILGATYQLFAHAFAKITLFFAAGSIIVMAHKENVQELEGLGKKLPITMTAFSIGAFSMIGFPLTFGFTAKWYLLLGSIYEDKVWVLIVLIISTLLNAIYFIPIIYKAFFMENDTHENIKENLPMCIAMVITSGCVIAFTFFGNILVKIITL